MQRYTRRGFTLFQLLVVLALLLILFALFLPALAQAKVAAARARSQNNLRQIGLSCHIYHDTNGFFPPGNDANNFSAAAYLLPYIEQDNLFKQIDFKKPMDDKANADARKVVVQTYLNPFDSVMNVSPDFGATNYLFNAGSKPALADNDGACYQASKIKLQDILDGTSNTLLTGETLKGDGGVKAMDVKRQHIALKKEALKDIKDDAGVQDFKDNKNVAGDRCASWMDGRFLQGTFTGTRVLNDEKPDVNCDGGGGLSGLRGLMDTVNVGFCDGSARSINKKLKLEVWKLLTARNDGQVFSID